MHNSNNSISFEPNFKTIDMNLVVAKELKQGNYYKVKGSNILVYIIDDVRYLRVHHYNHKLCIELEFGYEYDLNEFEIISKYSFNRMKRVVENKINNYLK